MAGRNRSTSHALHDYCSLCKTHSVFCQDVYVNKRCSVSGEHNHISVVPWVLHNCTHPYKVRTGVCLYTLRHDGATPWDISYIKHGSQVNPYSTHYHALCIAKNLGHCCSARALHSPCTACAHVTWRQEQLRAVHSPGWTDSLERLQE